MVKFKIQKNTKLQSLKVVTPPRRYVTGIHLHDTISHIRLSFWRMKTTTGATIPVHQLMVKFEMRYLYIQLFQLRFSPSKAEKSNTSAKGCWESLKNALIY